MKHRGVNIVRVQQFVGVDIGKREDSEVKPIVANMYSPTGMKYPMTLKECKESIDTLIAQTMSHCGCDERAAIKLLNQENQND